MTPASSSRPRTRPRRRCTVTVTAPSLTEFVHEVLFNLDLINGDGFEIKPGDLVAIDVMEQDKLAQNKAHKLQQQQHRDPGKDSPHGPDHEKRYICAVKNMPEKVKMRLPTVEVYVARHIADAFGMTRGSQVMLTAVDAGNPAVEASHVELSFKDQYLARSDMWRMAVVELSQRTVYKGQFLQFLATIKTQVTAVYVDGKQVQSAFFSQNTKPIFRSESARYVLFIQMSREMWTFDSDASGEIVFNKVVNGFLPALFKKWADLNVKHIVSIVLFARVEYDTGISTELVGNSQHDGYYTGTQSSRKRRPYKDFYRVAVSDMASGEWTKILFQLKREFNCFRRDIFLHHEKVTSSPRLGDEGKNREDALRRLRPKCSRAMYGNVLEAINMASALFAHDYIDRDLTRTGISVVVITPSPGVFEVDYDVLRRTTEALVGNGIGIDLICMPKLPLHSIPLFRYRNPLYLDALHAALQAKTSPAISVGSTPKQTAEFGSYSSFGGSLSPSKVTEGYSTSAVVREEWAFALPQWLHVSYWTGHSEEALSFQGIALRVEDAPEPHSDEEFPIRCRMYDLQMRSVMETNEIEIQPLHADPSFSPKTRQLGRIYSSSHHGAGTLMNQNLRVPEMLFDHVHGFQKFVPDRHLKAGESSLWKLLQSYDNAKARLPWSRKVATAQRRDRDNGVSARKQTLDDTGLLGTSYTERRRLTSFQQSPGREVRKLDTQLFPHEAPKFMRQLSLGRRGFGIAAPKATLTNVTAEAAKAESFTTRDDVGPGTPTRPLAVKNHVTWGAPGSILASTLRAETSGDDRDIKHSNAIRTEDAQKMFTSKLLAGAVPELSTTLSPTTSAFPWLTLTNPCNADGHLVDLTMLYSRWQHVFPGRPAEMRLMKWKSLCSPAAVPLTTEYFPTKAQLDADYERNSYTVSANADDEVGEDAKMRDDLLREMISLRLSQGFQIVIGPGVAKALGQKQVKIADVFSREYVAEDGTSIFMMVGNNIHQLACANDNEVNVNMFTRKRTGALAGLDMEDDDVYRAAVRTVLAQEYKTTEMAPVTPRPERKWNHIDTFLAGHHDEMSESLRFWRARFVLIPTAERHGCMSSGALGHQTDNEEEIRIEGIRQLAQLWAKHRYVPTDEKRYPSTGSRGKRGPYPLDIVYQTDDPSVVIAAELETLSNLEGLDDYRKSHLVTSRELFKKKNFGLAALAEAIQQPVESGGIRMQNRRWHLRLHYNCFIGSDMTSWLLDNFEDLEDREEAEALGNRLMVSEDDKSRDRGGGLFVHVEKRHAFRDGQYFYQVIGEYAKPHPPAWYSSVKRGQTSVPSTPLTEHMPRSSPRPALSKPISVLEDYSPMSGSTTPATAGLGPKKQRVLLSKMMKYDVDHRKRSYRAEVVDLHYDRLHNPENCYHIRLDWMNVTAKMVEDAVEKWAHEVAPYGLRLVEVPIAETWSIAHTNPFRRPYVVKLALPPPDQQPQTHCDANSFGPRTQPSRHHYQRAIMRHLDFVLDMEAAADFPSTVDVAYSWGRPEFRYTQLIHRSGVVLAEITDEGDILLLANSLYTNRAAAAREKEVLKERRCEQERTAPTPKRMLTPPLSSPMTRPVLHGGPASPVLRPYTVGPDSPPPFPAVLLTVPEALVIKDEVEAFCSNRATLAAFYKRLLEKPVPTAKNTPIFAPPVVPETSIPTLGLPPGVLSSTRPTRDASGSSGGTFGKRTGVQDGLLKLAHEGG